MHPFKLNTVPGNEDDPSDQLQTINNSSGPSTSSAPFISPSQSVTSKQCSEPPFKRPRLLKLFGLTKNELTETEIKEIDKCVVKMIVSDYQPLSIVENVGFLEYTKKLQPLYSVPSRKLLANKIVTIVSDNGSNIKNAINKHLLKYHHPCVAHTLNLSVNEAINGNFDVHQILKKCRAIVGHYKHSSLATGKLRCLYKVEL